VSRACGPGNRNNGSANVRNLYQYASNSPIYITNPSGRCPMCVVAIARGVIGGASAGYQAYKRGASGWYVAAAAAGGAGTGILAGLTGGLVGGIAIDEGASAVAAGAWGGAAGGTVSGFGRGEMSAANGGTTQTQVLVQTAEGAVVGAGAGAAGVAIGPTVQGGSNFNPRSSPVTWGPKAWQLYWQSAVGAAVCLAARKC
jgi:hypothetical protein